MDPVVLGLWSIVVLLVLIFARAPIGLAMLVVGIGGVWLISGSPAIFMARLKNEAYSSFSNHSLAIVPMFLLMGQIAALSGLSGRLFRAASVLVGHRRGGVAMAAVGACAGFGAICGSSLATAATMARVALPEMRAQGYSGGFSTAVLAAGGTLGILIPPSFILVIYAMLTEQNIATLFLAAIGPGVLAALGYVAVIAVYSRVVPGAAGQQQRVPWSARWAVLAQVWPVAGVFALVVLGIAGDWNWAKPGTQALFTPSEGAAIGAAGTALAAALVGGLSWRIYARALRETAISSAMIFFIVLGAGFYNGFLAMTQVPQELGAWIAAQGFAPISVLIVILLIYMVFGCLMDSLSMILLSVPVFWPVIAVLDFGMPVEHVAIWFGILVLIVVEVGLITPPVGLNLFIIRALDTDRTPITQTYRAVIWFVLSDVARVALILAAPAVVLWVL